MNNVINGLKAFAHRADPWGTIGIWFRIRGDSGPAYALPVQFRVVPREEAGIEQPPALKFDYEQAQQLMDALWTVGLRPTEGTGSAGALAATQRHLEDMRAIVFKQPMPKTQ